MTKIKMIIEYDGSRYHGYQKQANAAPTIQAELEDGIQSLTGLKVKLTSAGRTDAGVHALGQVVAFTSEASIPPDRWAAALNSVLPGDIRVLESKQVPVDFHPRFDAISKHYRYLIYRGQRGRIFLRRYACIHDGVLDLSLMQEACSLIQGQHNFKAFCSSGSSVKSFERTVYRCSLTEKKDLLYMDIEANGFLYNMVRIIMGSLLEIGSGRMDIGDIEQAFTTGIRDHLGPTAPPQGLYLMGVDYGSRSD